MKAPLTMDEARERGWVAADKQGIHTFSNGTHWDYWSDGNCMECAHWNRDEVGSCAFEAYSFLGMVSPELAQFFGWTRDEAGAAKWCAERNEADDPRQWWSEPEQCACFRQRKEDDDGNEIPPPPPTDPNQLVLIADPTEDAATFNHAPAPSAVTNSRVEVPA